jgi:aspartyl-tRNA(Asn)/glutamyl-tRNA(Gln) amidotransferase subunit B
MPELPDITRARLQAQGLSPRDTDVLMTVDAGREIVFDGEPPTKGAIAYFDKLAEGRHPKVVVNWMTHELLGQLALRKEDFGDNVVSVDQLGELIDLVQNGVVTGAYSFIDLGRVDTYGME